ncbi:hypothetical protein Nepgr_033608 [Nepenthes gracilis]|uniref:Uncharacterized protein n=1 Tax=Nepenthes gracilis TaxID=150966 RepID=A0AAD3TM53_NEPGR|nr:hypothetical protein Nepgr_033608 [Nepenthes gracilis]
MRHQCVLWGQHPEEQLLIKPAKVPQNSPPANNIPLFHHSSQQEQSELDSAEAVGTLKSIHNHRLQSRGHHQRKLLQHQLLQMLLFNSKFRIDLQPTKHSTLNKIRSHFHHQTRDPCSFISCCHPTTAYVGTHPSRKLNPRKTTSKFTVAELQPKRKGYTKDFVYKSSTKFKETSKMKIHIQMEV